MVVIHIGYAEFTSAESTAAAEVERLGLISAEVARRIACTADIALAFDDELGHTMFEGRAERFATDTQRREVWRDQRCVDSQAVSTPTSPSCTTSRSGHTAA